MQNKTGILVLTIIIALLCVYNLSFTVISNRIDNQAEAASITTDGNVDFVAKQAYLDSIWREPVYSFFGSSYTYQEVKERELKKGLDLQGGMHVVLEVSPVDIIKGMAGNNADPRLNAALEDAQKMQAKSPESFTTLFAQAYAKRAPDAKLAPIFATSANRNQINAATPNNEVLKVLDLEIDGAIDRAFEIIRTRIDKFGVTQPNIQRLPGTGRIQVELPGNNDPARVRKLLSGVAKLEFFEVYEGQEINPYLQELNNYVIGHNEDSALQAIRKKVMGRKGGTEIPTLNNNQVSLDDEELGLTDTTLATENGLESLSETDDTSELASEDTTDPFATPTADTNKMTLADAGEADTTTADTTTTEQSPLLGELFAPVQNGLAVNVDDTGSVMDIFRLPGVVAIFPKNMMLAWSVKPFESTDGQRYMSLYFLKTGPGGDAPIEGEVVVDARQGIGENGMPDVSMQMNATGAKQWKRLTTANIGERIAIVLDDFVYSAPVVQGEIPSGQSSISGNFTVEEAKDLANVLKAGKLPAPTRIVEEAIVGPSLGKASIQKGLASSLAGLAIVVVLMLIYYNTGGLVANLALLTNIFFILGILAQFNAALTLPGIAGIVLTIGMSVDANVLIFERIKEELANGLIPKKAIAEGYKRALSSIIDANVTTLLTAIILFRFGTGGVKGFAFTLIIGILASLFTAILITRLILEFRGKKKEEPAKFTSALSKAVMRKRDFDFLSGRKKVYLISAGFIVLGIVAIVIKGGLNLGVDFKGGRSYIVEFSEPINPSVVEKSVAKAFGGQGTEVKTYNASNQLKITTSYLIDNESETADQSVRDALSQGLAEYQELKPEVLSSTKVGATIADDIQRTARTSVILSLLAIFLYILIRFRRWQYGLGAVIALFHDVLVVFAAFGLARLMGISFEIDQVFIAAILTVVGYSINDTVVVFDRIREFSTRTSTFDLDASFNQSISATINRTIMTSVTTLVVVLTLLLFGGDAIRGFSFALLIGVMVGTYSSIFIASPVVYEFSKKKAKPAPEPAK